MLVSQIDGAVPIRLGAPCGQCRFEGIPGTMSQSHTLGSVIRSIRTRNGWTLKEMSARSGIPMSTLSKVEHDRLTLTYDKLLQLSQRLSLRISDLFAESSEA